MMLGKNKLECLLVAKILNLVGKAKGAQLSSKTENIILGCPHLPRTNTLAYYR